MLSPAEAHSGWEDHNGGDLMHYIHHGEFDSFHTAVPVTNPKEWGAAKFEWYGRKPLLFVVHTKELIRGLSVAAATTATAVSSWTKYLARSATACRNLLKS